MADGRGAAARRERPREAAANVALREVAERAAEVVAEPRPEEVGRGPRRGLRGRNACVDGNDRKRLGRRARTGGGAWAWRAIEPVRPIVRRRAGLLAAGGACAKPGGGGLPSPPQLLKAAIAGFSSSAVSEWRDASGSGSEAF